MHTPLRPISRYSMEELQSARNHLLNKQAPLDMYEKLRLGEIEKEIERRQDLGIPR